MVETLLAKITPQGVMSAFSAGVTGYFWLIKARKERPRLSVYQLQSFRPSLRRGPDEQTKRLSLVQTEPGGVLIANHSIRQNSIIRHDSFIRYGGRTIRGTFGWVNDDRPPWNIGPESTISLSLACFFDVPDDCELPEDFDFRVEFVTASGHRFSHVFNKQAPEL